MSMTKDPSIMELVGRESECAQDAGGVGGILPSTTGFAYREQIEQQMGAALP